MSVKVKSKKSHLWHIVRFGVAFVALYFAFRGQSISEVGKVFSGINIWVFLLAMTLYMAGQLIFVCRWRILLWAQGIKIDYWPVVRLHFLGLFYNNCLPSSVGGDLVRAWYVTKHTDKKVAAALSVFVDRAIGLFCTVAMVFIAYLVVPSSPSGGQLEFSVGSIDIGGKIARIWPVLMGFCVIILVVVAVLFAFKKTRVPVIGLIIVAKSKFGKLVIHLFENAKLYLCRPFTLLFAIFLSFLCQSMSIVGFWLIGRNLGIEADIRYYFMFFPLSWIIGIIPISIGGAGVVELGIKGMFSRVTTVTALQGLILALTQRVIFLIASLPGVVIHIFGRHLPDEEQMAAEMKSGRIS